MAIYAPYFNSRPSARGDHGAGLRPAEADDFNSRPSARGDTVSNAEQRIVRFNFNSRPSARGDAHAFQVRVVLDKFQFTPLREGRRHTPHKPWHGRHFNSRPSARGDQERRERLPNRKNFNSRPSARGDISISMPNVCDFISIHAPPRGATYHQQRSATYRLFQFTPLREGRQSGSILPGRIFKISIHAPPRGATCREAILFLRLIHFNSRPSARGDF